MANTYGSTRARPKEQDLMRPNEAKMDQKTSGWVEQKLGPFAPDDRLKTG